MSVQSALDFIAYLRQMEPGAPELILDPPVENLQVVVQAGEQLNFAFSDDELRAAFRHDWQHRWQRFGVSTQR
jgi:hypothetical protein